MNAKQISYEWINTFMSDYQEVRIVYEFTSSIMCFILVWFMLKPYRFTRKRLYAVLPLAFGLLGASYLISALAYTQPQEGLLWFQLVARAFSFVFLAATYYFANKQSVKSQFIWNISSSLIAIIILTAIIVIIFMPRFDFGNYRVASEFVRIFIIICLVYIIVNLLRKHMTKPDSTTLMFPLGYILLAISQYSIIIWAVDQSMFAWWGALVLRWAGFAIFLFVTYVTFYRSKTKGI